MWARFTERARRAVWAAQDETGRLGHDYVNTEHLLLGLTRESDSVAARLLLVFGVEMAKVRRELEARMEPGVPHPGKDLQLTPRGKRVIDLAYEEARQLNNNYIGTEHLLLGLIRERDGLAAQVLISLGADLERTRKVVEAMQEGKDLPGAAAPPTAPPVAPAVPVTTAAAAADRPDPWRHLWEMPYSELRKLAEYAKSDRNPAGAASAAMVAVDLARSNCRGVTDLKGITDLNRDEAWAILSLARVLKDTLAINKTSHREILPGKTLAMIFEKPSLRTRVSFEAGMYQLGGHAMYLAPSDIGLGSREPVGDVARVLDRMVEGIMARVFAHETITQLADAANVPVINGLCDLEHPCQALADFLTIWEHHGGIEGQQIAYVGDGNNVAHSLALLAAKLGAHIRIASPRGYEPKDAIIPIAQDDASHTGGSVTIFNDPKVACTDADVVYTDVWASMGQEAEAAQREKEFAGFQVDAALAAVAKPNHLFLHCLPAHRGSEVSADVADGPNSVMFDQAENRLHVQKAVLAVLLG